jgi:hypothetical protein
MAYATTGDVEARLGRTLTASEQGQVTAWLEDLEALVVSRLPGFAESVTAGVTSESVVRAVFASAVIRVLRNPEGLRQHTESIDDYSITKTIDASASAGLLYLTDDEWNLLSPGASGEAFTIRPYGVASRPDGWWVHPDTWVPYS